MKPSKVQIKACEEIKKQLSFWMSTNDLSSPTHSCDISETMNNCVVFEELTENQANELEIKLIDLLCFIRELK